ncbi:MAG: DUF1059 domain-containing protein [Candidatus Nitrosocaldaceae archaeon]
MKFKCKDVGMNCDFEIKNVSNENEAMEIAKVHAKYAHNISEITPDLAEKVKKAIK